MTWAVRELLVPHLQQQGLDLGVRVEEVALVVLQEDGEVHRLPRELRLGVEGEDSLELGEEQALDRGQVRRHNWWQLLLLLQMQRYLLLVVQAVAGVASDPI